MGGFITNYNCNCLWFSEIKLYRVIKQQKFLHNDLLVVLIFYQLWGISKKTNYYDDMKLKKGAETWKFISIYTIKQLMPFAKVKLQPDLSFKKFLFTS